MVNMNDLTYIFGFVFIFIIISLTLSSSSLKVVGVTVEELEAAQQWNVQGVLDLLKRPL